MTESDAASTRWQHSLAEAIRDPQELLQALELPLSLLPDAVHNTGQFPLLVPRSYLRRMQKGDRHDPLLRQVLPVADEELTLPGFSSDPVADHAARQAPGLLQKYAGRVLLVTTGACAVHCRYCFRRHYPYRDEPRRLDDWQPAIRAIAADPSVQEVILSGGDPLMLTDARLSELIRLLQAVPHLKRLRLHSRLPIVLPDRVDDHLLTLLQETSLTPILVVHANHPAEVVDDCAAALTRLVKAGITTLNQAVLLRGVNDSLEPLTELSIRLVNCGVLPYYLHQLDRVAGGAHFEVPVETGQELITGLRARLPGYAVPRYVAEIAGADSKTPLELA